MRFRWKGLVALWVVALSLGAWAGEEEAHVRTVVSRILENVRKLREADPAAVPMAFWDFDGTIIRGDIGGGYIENGVVRYRGLIEEVIDAGFLPMYRGEGGYRKWRRDYTRMTEVGPWLAQGYDAQMFTGVAADELDAFCRKTIREKGLDQWYFASSVAIWKALAEAGVENYVVSANIEALVRNTAFTLGIPPERVRGARTELDGGRWTTRLLLPIPFGEGKTDVVRNLVNTRPHGVAIAAFGNSYATDGAFLRYVATQPSLPGGAVGTAMMINGQNPVPGFKEHFICVEQQATVVAQEPVSPWVSAQELEAVRSRVCAMDFNPGTPETDAARFYSNTQKTEFVEFNYDEAKAGELGRDYTLEDPLIFADGRKVASPADWPSRRQELLSLFEREVYGRLPPKPAEMTFEILEEKMSEDRFATLRKYRQYFRADRTGPFVDWFVALPRQAKGKVPVFLHLNYAGLDAVAAKKTNHYDLPWDQLLANGYAFMSATYTQITGDGAKRGGFFNGVCKLWGARDPQATDNPGSLMIWAWGLMRGLDLAERIVEIDATRNVVIGSSRFGKAALLAAAYDERFKVCIPNQTGAVGVQLMKRDYGENLKGQRLSVPHWYCSSVWKYAENPKAQPFDQHLLLACVAPRALLLECYHKKWFDPKGEWLAARAASPVWTFLTGQGLAAETWPEPYSEALVKPPFGYVRRTECHGLSPYDWKWAMDFANAALKK